MPAPEQPPAARRRWRPWSLLRPAMIGTALLVVYYALPLDRAGPGTALTLVAGLTVLGALVAWLMRAVMTSPSPRLRAAESLATSILLYIVLFAGAHTTLSKADPDAYTELLDRTDALRG